MAQGQTVKGQSESGRGIPVRVNELGEIVTANSPEYATRVDDTTTADVVYIGNAPIGSASGASVWQIKKLDTSSGVVTTWADGDALFNNVWDNRASLSYS